MAVKNLFMIFGLILIVGCSMAAPGSHATADLKDKDGKTVGRAVLRDTADALVIHVGVDDYVTDPTGNAGDRAACGLIVAD